MQPPTQPQHIATPAYFPTREEILKIEICVPHARDKNKDFPGCYEEELNETLKLNNLPITKIPKKINEGAISSQPKSTPEDIGEFHTPKAKARAVKSEYQVKTSNTDALSEEIAAMEE